MAEYNEHDAPGSQLEGDERQGRVSSGRDDYPTVNDMLAAESFDDDLGREYSGYGGYGLGDPYSGDDDYGRDPGKRRYGVDDMHELTPERRGMGWKDYVNIGLNALGNVPGAGPFVAPAKLGFKIYNSLADPEYAAKDFMVGGLENALRGVTNEMGVSGLTDPVVKSVGQQIRNAPSVPGAVGPGRVSHGQSGPPQVQRRSSFNPSRNDLKKMPNISRAVMRWQDG